MAVSWTGSSLVTELSTLLGDTSAGFQSKVLGWLNDIQRDICARHDWDFLRVKGKKILTAEDEEQTLIPSAPAPALTDDPNEEFTEDFASDAGFVYDSDDTEFSGGQVQQVDNAPADSTCWATYTSSIDLSCGGGTTTGTAAGGAAIVGNRLDLTGATVKYVDYDADSNADSQQTGAIKLKFTPNYSGSPVSNYALFSITETSGSSNNLMQLLHITSGVLLLQVRDQAAGVIMTYSSPAWSPTASQTYEFELNYDLTAGATRIFIDGNLHGVVQTGTGTRSSSIGLLRVGNNNVGTYNSDFYIEDFVVFSAVQHTANYTPGYTLTEGRYLGDTIELPQFAYSGDGSVQTWDGFTVSESGDPRYILNSQYWSGSAWVTSDGTFAQANTAADVATNIASLAAADTLNVKIRTDGGCGTQMSVSDLAVEYTGQINAAIHAELATGGSLTEGSTYAFKVAFYEGTTYTETEVSPESSTVTTDASHKSITLSGIAVSTEPLTTARRIYVSKDGGTYYYHSTISDNTTTSTTITTDTTSTVEVQDTHNIRKLFGNVFFETTINRTLEYKDIDQMRLVFPGPFNSGSPAYWSALSEERVLMYPKPSDAYTLSFYYFRRPRDLYNETTSVPTIPEWLKPVLKAGVIAMGYEYRDRDGQQQKLQNYEDLLAQYISRTASTTHIAYRVRDVEGDADGWEI